jgi:transcriptional regulator with XRE-family HTH domain
LDEAIRVARMTQTGLAEQIGVTRSTVYRWRNGLKSPTTDEIEVLARALRVDRDWLAIGTGPMGPTGLSVWSQEVIQQALDAVRIPEKKIKEAHLPASDDRGSARRWPASQPAPPKVLDHQLDSQSIYFASGGRYWFSVRGQTVPVEAARVNEAVDYARRLVSACM